MDPNKVYNTKYVNALILRSREPHSKIIKNIGINKLSKNKQNKNKSKVVNVKIKKNSMSNKLININLPFFSCQLAKIQNGNNNAVKIKKTNEIPSNPKLISIPTSDSHGVSDKN